MEREMQRQTLGRAGAALLAAAVIFGGSNFVMPWLFEKIDYSDRTFPYIQFAFIFALYAVTTLVMWLLMHGVAYDRELPKSRVKAGTFIGYFCACRGLTFVVLSLGLVLTMMVLLLSGRIQDAIKTVFDQVEENMRMGPPTLAGIGVTGWLNIAASCVLAPVFEELMLRKILLDPLRRFGDAAAIIYTSLAFGLLHMTFEQLFFTTLMGLITGYLMVRTNNIWYCIALHFVFNAASSVSTFFGDGTAGMQLSIAYTSLIFAVGLVGVVLFFKSIKTVRLDPPPETGEVIVKPVRTVLLRWDTILYAVICLGITVAVILVNF